MDQKLNLFKEKVFHFFSKSEVHIVLIMISILLAYKNLFTVFFLSDDLQELQGLGIRWFSLG